MFQYFVRAGMALIAVPALCLLAPVDAQGQEKLSKTTEWINPMKGKIQDKVNLVEIPLTANEQHLLGHVKTVRYKNYKLDAGKDMPELTDSGYNIYDRAGHLVEQNAYKPDGTRRWKCIYKYNDKGQAQEYDFSFNYSKAEHITILFKYDEKGNQVEQRTYDVDSNMTLVGVETITYDDKGHDLVHHFTNRDGETTRILTYTYDPATGYQVQMKDENMKRKMTQWMNVTYDADGNKTGWNTFINDSITMQRFMRKNDERGRPVTTWTLNKDATSYLANTTKYDEHDNIVEFKAYTSKGKDDQKASFGATYEYDKMGNKTKGTLYKTKQDAPGDVRYEELSYTYYN